MGQTRILGASLTKVVLAGVSVCALLALGPNAAGALEDLTGRYEGKAVCTALAGGEEHRGKPVPAILLIADDGSGGVLASITLGGALLGTARGYALAPDARPDRGVMNLVACGFDLAATEGAFLHADVSTRVGSDRATVRGTLFAVSGDQGAGVCRLSSLRRVSTDTPLLFCP